MLKNVLEICGLRLGYRREVSFQTDQGWCQPDMITKLAAKN
jgi:hypothetical protein